MEIEPATPPHTATTRRATRRRGGDAVPDEVVDWTDVHGVGEVRIVFAVEPCSNSDNAGTCGWTTSG